MATNFNPQYTAEEIRLKSFLKQRGNCLLKLDTFRQTTGSVFFRDNKIRSCSYVKETANTLKAVPFYNKRDSTLYPTPSTVIQSWNSSTYTKPNTVYAGMGTQKPLHVVFYYLFSMILSMPEILQQLLIFEHLIEIPLKLKSVHGPVEIQSIT